LGLDTANDAANVKELGGTAKERLLVCVKPEAVVAEQAAQVQKVTGAATKVENLQGWRTIEPKILRSPDIHADPVLCILVRIDLASIWPVGIALA
jgi:hypothetical protein